MVKKSMNCDYCLMNKTTRIITNIDGEKCHCCNTCLEELRTI